MNPPLLPGRIYRSRITSLTVAEVDFIAVDTESDHPLLIKINTGTPLRFMPSEFQDVTKQYIIAWHMG